MACDFFLEISKEMEKWLPQLINEYTIFAVFKVSRAIVFLYSRNKYLESIHLKTTI